MYFCFSLFLIKGFLLILIYIWILGPLVYFNGTNHILVGATSYGLGDCAGSNVVDGFAEVYHALEWIKQNSDAYVTDCSTKKTLFGLLNFTLKINCDRFSDASFLYRIRVFNNQ
jgi:hypothetical protein